MYSPDTCFEACWARCSSAVPGPCQSVESQSLVGGLPQAFEFVCVCGGGLCVKTYVCIIVYTYICMYVNIIHTHIYIKCTIVTNFKCAVKWQNNILMCNHHHDSSLEILHHLTKTLCHENAPFSSTLQPLVFCSTFCLYEFGCLI